MTVVNLFIKRNEFNANLWKRFYFPREQKKNKAGKESRHRHTCAYKLDSIPRMISQEWSLREETKKMNNKTKNYHLKRDDRA